MARLKANFIIQIIVVLFILQAGQVFAQSQSLPAIPGQTILNQVINQTNGPTFTPFGTPIAIKNQLNGFSSSSLPGVPSNLDYDKAISYFDRSGNLMELVIPIKNSATAVLDPNMTTPGANPMPGKIIGAVWQRGRGTRVVVAVFQQGSNGASLPPMELRFYTNSTSYYTEGMLYSAFVDYFNDGRLERVDAGAVIAAYNSCISIGLEQVCWYPYSLDVIRDQMSKDLIQAAWNRATARYQIMVGFDLPRTVPDMIGANRRSTCASQLNSASSFDNLTRCAANLVMTSSSSAQPGQPIGLWVVRAAADLKAYRTNGTYTGSVPVGEYLVVDATPTRNTPGQVGVLMLVNINSNDHYLIPSVAMQSFANNSSIEESQAGVKDGTIRFRGF
ncbi:MAG: hypothetical protein J0M33_09220 [Anaerolineae bacterium]|nr:hypothetical protein [Anaerolineae bacterium]